MTAEFIATADWKARCFVNGTRYDAKLGETVICSGEWSDRFRGHPWVEQAEQEGWGIDLRAAVVFAVKRRILEKQEYSNVESLMPPKKWVDQRRQWAEKSRLAAEWRERVCAQYGSVDAFLIRFKRGLRAA